MKKPTAIHLICVSITAVLLTGCERKMQSLQPHQTDAPPTHSQKDSPEAAQSNETTQPVSIGQHEFSTSPSEKPTQEKNYGWFRKLFYDLKITDIAIAVFTGLLFWCTWLLYKAGVRQEKILKASSIDSRRAFLPAPSIECQSSFDQGNSVYNWKFWPLWQNHGDTVAKNVRLITSSQTTDKSHGNIPDFRDSPDGKAPVATSAGEITAGNKVAISAFDIRRIEVGQVDFYIWGLAKYSDIFPGTPEHTTKFCYKLKVILNISVDRADRFEWQTHTQHNSAD